MFVLISRSFHTVRHLGPGGPGARAPPRIEILLSKNFQNGQNFIFLLFGPPLRKNRSQGPVYKHEFILMPLHLTLLVWYFSSFSSHFFGTFLVLFSMNFSYFYYMYMHRGFGLQQLTNDQTPQLYFLSLPKNMERTLVSDIKRSPK